MSRVEEGTNPVIYLSVLIVGLMIVLFILFIIFLDLAVLRRVVKLSKLIHKQTAAQGALLKDADDDAAKSNDTKGKKGKSSSGSTRLSSGKMSGSDGSGPSSGDEIKNLKIAVEKNNSRLRRRAEDINDVLRIEHQKTVHHKQAMQLLSLWCDRSDFFPGLRPNAILYRYEPTRNMDDLLTNPLAIEYLKSHCDSDCTLENLFFILDVSWLAQLEGAEDDEEDPAKRKLIHQVVVDTASNIISRYIAENAPQQINVSAATFMVLRGKGNSYKRDMFKDAVSEVKLMLNTDILPRFRNTTAYTAMSENMYVDSLALDDDSDLSSESASTAGSVLSDEADNGANNMVAFNFKNLYATYDTDTDVVSTCTNEMSVVEDPVSPTSLTAHSDMRLLGTSPTLSSSYKGSSKMVSAADGSDASSSMNEIKDKPSLIGAETDHSETASVSSDLASSASSSSSSD